MLKNKVISIIIPVYNAEKYLKTCINSIIGQTYKYIEIILINDGSIDNSSKICDEYARIDNRIKVIHKENGGPSLARENGVRIATGDYIAFVDADDYIDKNMYEVLINETNNGADIVECGYREVSKTYEVIREHNLVEDNIKGLFNCSLNYASQKNTTNFLWNKLYKAKLLKDVVFPKLYAGEDSCILTQVYAYAEQVVIINQSFYNYVMTPNSLCRQPFSWRHLDNIEAGKFMYEFYSKNMPKLCGFSGLHICSYSARLYCEIANEDLEDINLKKEKMKWLLDNFNSFYNLSSDKLTRSICSKRRSFFVELFNISPRISIWIYNLFLKPQ